MSREAGRDKTPPQEETRQNSLAKGQGCGGSEFGALQH